MEEGRVDFGWREAYECSFTELSFSDTPSFEIRELIQYRWFSNGSIKVATYSKKPVYVKKGRYCSFRGFTHYEEEKILQLEEWDGTFIIVSPFRHILEWAIETFRKIWKDKEKLERQDIEDVVEEINSWYGDKNKYKEMKYN